jgi:acetyl-CoA carboxylase carboxyl transferase subunit beta
MLGDIIISEPNAYIAFAGKRVIEQTLNKTVPDGSQAAEYSFHKGFALPWKSNYMRCSEMVEVVE